MSRMILRASPVLMVLACALGGAPAAAAPPTLDERLARLVETLEQRRQELDVPGMAIAIVKDDELILSRGFGLADIEHEEPATDETLFAVGSTTKAFTATLIGMLVDEGLMSWDEPARTHLPTYRLADPEADAKVNIRDLLSHRIGVASMSMLWFGNDVTHGELLATYGRAKLLHPFRERFGYSNLSYLAAGLASAGASGTDWEALLADRLLAPLGMTSSNTSRAEALSDPRMAVGYVWDEDAEELQVHPMRDVSAVAPAGAINSSVRDMAQWIRLQLGRGAIGGERLISEAAHAETWKPHVSMSEDVQYGLGWFVRDWRGTRMIDHSGGIDGFTAKVAMLPDEQLGFVLLTNLFATPLVEMAPALVFDALLGTVTDETPPLTDDDVTPMLGTYIGNFGHFKDAKFEVVLQNGRLAVDVPGQMVFELNEPDDDDRRTFVITDAVAVRFVRNEGVERARSLIMEQAGFVFELPREGVEMPVEIDLEAARELLGTYTDSEGERTVNVVMQNNRLALDIPGQMVFELHPPDADGRWVFRARDSLWTRFTRDEIGDVQSMTALLGGQERTFTRLAGAGDDLPAAAEVMQLVHRGHGAEHLATLRSLRAEGTVTMEHLGTSGTVKTLLGASLRQRSELDFGRFGRIRTACDGERGWSDTAFLGLRELHGPRLEQLRRTHLLILLDDWKQHYDQVQVSGREIIDERDALTVRLHPAEGPSEVLVVDAESGLILEHRQSPMTEIGTRIQVTTRYGDHRTVNGVTIPFRTRTSNDITGAMVVQFERVEPNVDVQPGDFTITR